MDSSRRESLKEIVDKGVGTLQSLLSYLLLPVALPLLFAQECLSWIKERLGLNQRSMEGKVVLITGASSGIGESLAHSFYVAGCRIILCSRRKEELERVKDDLVRRKVGGPSTKVYVPAVLEMDVGDLKSIPNKAKQALQIYDGIDILVNNAGILHSGNVLDTGLDVDQRIMQVNYFGSLALTKVIANSMKEKRSGHVVFMSSVSGKISVPHSSAYCASKHAMQALADSLRAEVADDNILVTSICPGYVKTNISKNALNGSGSNVGRMTRNIKNGLSPEDVADRTLQAIKGGEKDVIIAPFVPKAAVFLRYLVPSGFFFIMKRLGRAYNKIDKEQGERDQGAGSGASGN